MSWHRLTTSDILFPPLHYKHYDYELDVQRHLYPINLSLLTCRCRQGLRPSLSGPDTCQCLVMPSNGIGREEPSPHDDTPAPKRRRIAFSCRDCRRRKLRCDRVFPSCSRCQKGGHPESCSYDSEAVESTLTHFPEERNRTRDLSTANGLGAPRVIHGPSPVAPSFGADEGAGKRPRFQSEDTAARLYAQEERIRQLEYRINGLEKATHDARRPERTENEPKQYSDPKAAVNKDMIFRGKDFKTQFYGASHHTSYLSHVRWITFSIYYAMP